MDNKDKSSIDNNDNSGKVYAVTDGSGYLMIEILDDDRDRSKDPIADSSLDAVGRGKVCEAHTGSGEY